MSEQIKKWANGVKWTAAERRIVLLEMFRLVEQFPNEKSSFLAMNAQNKLPPERRRSVGGIKAGRKTIKLFDSLCELFDSESGEIIS